MKIITKDLLGVLQPTGDLSLCPIVESSALASLYDKHDGAANADLAIQHFEKKGVDVIKVSSDEGLNHPTFTNNSINGIYLPGGSDIPIK